MKHNYKVVYYYSKEDGGFLTFAPELPGCCADGATLKDALTNLDDIIDEWIDVATELGRDIPEPMGEDYISSSPNIFDVSKYILERMGNISTMTLEKLSYYCLVWSLVWFGRPLFDNKFQAWKKGPVCKELYDFHRGRRVISARMIASNHILSPTEMKVIDCVLAVYGDENGEFLSELTHGEKPWNETRGNIPKTANCEKEIDNNLIRESYMY